MKISFRWIALVGVALFAWILWRTDVGLVLSNMRGASPYFVGIAIATTVFEVVVKSVKWQHVTRIYHEEYGFRDALETYLIGIAYGNLTPARLGDAVKIFDLKQKTGMKLEKALSIQIFDRVIDTSFLVLSALGALLLAAFLFTGFQSRVFSLLIVFGLLLVLLWLAYRLPANMLKPFYNALVPGKYKKIVRSAFYTFRDVTGAFRGSYHSYIVIAMTVLGWMSLFIRPYIYGLAIGVTGVSPWVFLLFTPIIVLVEMLPISIMGVGTRESMMIFLYSFVSLMPETVVTISMFLLFLSILPQGIAGLIIALGKDINMGELS